MKLSKIHTALFAFPFFSFCSYASNNILINSDGYFDITSFNSKKEEDKWTSNPSINKFIINNGIFEDTTTPPNNNQNNLYIINGVGYGEHDVTYSAGVFSNNKNNEDSLNNAVIFNGDSVYSIIGTDVSFNDADAFIENNIMESGTAFINGTSKVTYSVLGNSYFNNLIFEDSNSNEKPFNITSNGSVYLTDSSVSSYVYGNKFDSTLENNSSTNVNFDINVNGNVYMQDSATADNVTYGSYFNYIASNMSAFKINSNIDVNGNIYLKDNSRSPYTVYGAYTFIQNANNTNIKGNVYLQDSAVVANGITGVLLNNYGMYDENDTINATGNIYLKDESIAGSNIYGVDAYLTNKGINSVNGNVYIYGNVNSEKNIENSGLVYFNEVNLYGVHLNYASNNIYYNVFSGNTLSFGNSALKVNTLGNFETYNFYLNDYNKSYVNTNTALLTVANLISNDNTVTKTDTGSEITTNKSTVNLAGISGVGIVNKAGDSIKLIDASGVSTFTGGDNTNNIDGLFTTKTGDVVKDINVGLVGKADAHYVVDGNIISAVIDDIRISKERVNLNVKPLAEARIATLQNTVRAADLLVNQIMGENKPVGTFTPIALIDGGLNTYKSGSKVYGRDYRVMVGSRYQFLDNLYGGFALEYGRSNYDTRNHFDEGRVKGDGHTYNYGLSLFGKYTYDLDVGSLYADAAFRFGRTNTEFQSGDIVTGSGDYAHYKSKVNYIGGILGAGYIYPLNEVSNLDSSLHYFYTRLGSDSIVLDGDKVNFEKATSSKVQLKEKYSYQSSQDIKLTLAGIYEYEFNGKSKANVSGISANAPSVKGSTGILEVGMISTPLENKDFSLNVNVRGYGGKREGVSAGLLAKYDF